MKDKAKFVLAVRRFATRVVSTLSPLKIRIEQALQNDCISKTPKMLVGQAKQALKKVDDMKAEAESRLVQSDVDLTFSWEECQATHKDGTDCVKALAAFASTCKKHGL